MYTRLTCKGLDICPLPADNLSNKDRPSDSCFRGGAGARGGKPPVAQMPCCSEQCKWANVGVCQSAAAAVVVVGGVYVCSGTAP